MNKIYLFAYPLQIMGIILIILGCRWMLVDEPWMLDEVANVERLNMTFDELFSSEINKKQLTLDKLSSKLGNPNFIEKAPADVVAKEQARLDELSSQIETLRQQQVALEKIIGDNATT